MHRPSALPGDASAGIRTTNLLERLFVEERRRLKIIPNAFGERAALVWRPRTLCSACRHAPSRTTSAPCAPVPCQFQLSGRNLDQAAEGYRQDRVASRRTLSPRRLNRNEHEPPAERVVAFYNKRGTCEQWIKEGKGAIKWTRLSCRTFAANAVRLQLHALAYNLGNFLRTLATSEPIKDWSLTSLKDKLIKIGARVMSHGRYVIFQMAEVAIARQMFQEILRLIVELRPQPPPALA